MEAQSVITEAKVFLEELLRAAQLDLQFDCQAEDSFITVKLQGSDGGLVLEDNARLLYAINHILNRVFYERKSTPCSFVVDCNQYRQVRAEELEGLARQAAETVKGSGELFLFEHMPASERRVVHLALAEDPGVCTESEGSGVNRRVVILPAK